MVAILYMIIGVCLGWIVREVFYVPRDFHYGILVVSRSQKRLREANRVDGVCLQLGYEFLAPLQQLALTKPGNLPIAVVQTVALGEPFDPNRDVELGVAYIS